MPDFHVEKRIRHRVVLGVPNLRRFMKKMCIRDRARAVVDGMSEAIAAIAAADPKDASEYTEEQINLVTEVYKAYNELELVDKTAVEATDEWKTFSEITAGIGRLYHYDEVAGIDMRDNGEEALPWYVKLSASPKTLSLIHI